MNGWQEQLARLAARYQLVEDRVTVAGRTFEFLRPPSADALIDEDDFNRDERLPYWAEIWPSSIVLAAHLSAVVKELHPSGVAPRLLELGAGAGLASLAAVAAGFDVLATDYYDDALSLLAINAARQGLAPPTTRMVDWRALPDDLGTFDVVVGADILYEKAYPALVADTIVRTLAAGGTAVITDPQRIIAARFPDECRQRGLMVETAAPVVASHGAVRQTVDLFRIGRADTLPRNP